METRRSKNCGYKSYNFAGRPQALPDLENARRASGPDTSAPEHSSHALLGLSGSSSWSEGNPVDECLFATDGLTSQP